MKTALLLFGIAVSLWAQPGAPTNLACAVGSGKGTDIQVNVTWIRADDTDTSITVERSLTSGGTYTPLVLTAGASALPAHSNIFNDLNAFPATTYYYKVFATNGGGNSAAAGPVNCTTSASTANTFSAAGSFTATNTDAWTNTLTWTDSNSGFRYWVVQYSTDGVNYFTVDPLVGATQATGYVHGRGNSNSTALQPGTLYYYRARVQNDAGGYSNWATGSATTASAPGGSANVPTGLACVVNSATSTTCTWTDTNSGGKAYGIYTSAFNNMSPSFSLLATTAAGATSYTLTTTAETFYYLTIRADPAGTPSGYTPTVKIRTASPTIGGGGNTYNVTLGTSTYPSIGSSPIATGLGPGDTVNIGAGTYYEAFIISNRGTAANPITINCAAGAIIDGTNAVVAAASQFSDPQYTSDLALISFGRRSGMASSTGWSPGYVNFKNCTIQNAVNGQSYSYAGGATRTWVHPSGFYIFTGDHINLSGNTVHNFSDGIFGAGTDDTRNLEVISVGVCPNGNYLYGNGEPGGTLYHNIYLEGINMTYECNKFGDLVATAAQSACVGMKDRSAGAIFRYNKVVTATQQGSWIIFGEAQNYAQFTTVNPLLNSISVYGNDFEDTTATGSTSSPAWIAFGYPGSFVANGRGGPYLIYDNTMVFQSNRTPTYHGSLFDTQVPASTVDARNNIIWNGATSGNTAQTIYLMGWQAGQTAYFGENWVSSVGYYVCNQFKTCAETFSSPSGAIVNNGATNNPGFTTSPTNAVFNLALTVGGQAVSAGGVLGGNWPVPNEQYVDPNSGTARSNIADLGAYQYGSTPTANAPTFSPVGGTYASTQSVTISSTTGGASICYNTTGTPTATVAGTCDAGSTTYTTPVSVSSSETLYTIATESGYINSTISSASYTITSPIVANPTFSPVAGSYLGTQTVTISDGTAGATICYTLNGLSPAATVPGTCDPGSIPYAGTIPVSSSLTITALGTKAGAANSSVVGAGYTITPTSGASIIGGRLIGGQIQ